MNHLLIILLSLAVGAVGFLLRTFHLRTAFDPETLLPVGSSASWLLVLFLLAAVTLCLIWGLPGRGRRLSEVRGFDSPEGPALSLITAGGFLTILAGALSFAQVLQRTAENRIISMGLGLLAILSGCAVIGDLFLRSRGGENKQIMIAPVLFYVVWLLTISRTYAAYPVTSYYFIQILAAAALVYAFYLVSGWRCCGEEHAATRVALPLAVILCCTALADPGSWSQRGLYAGGAVTLLGYLATLRY